MRSKTFFLIFANHRNLFKFFTAFLFVALAALIYFFFIRIQNYWGILKFYDFDSQLGITLRANQEYSISYQACCMPLDVMKKRDRTFLIKVDPERRRVVENNPADAPEVVIFGDSNLFGMSLGQGETIADRLSEKVRDAGRSVRISNYSVPGSNSYFLTGQAGYLLAGRIPAALIIGLGSNDSKPIAPDALPLIKSFIEELKTTDKNKKLLFLKTVLRYFFINLRNTLKSDPAPEVPFVGPEEFKVHIESVLGLVDPEKTDVILILTPTPFSGMSDHRPNPYLSKLEAVAAEHRNIAIIDQAALTFSSIAAAKNASCFENERRRIKETYTESSLSENDVYWVTTDGGHPNPIFAVMEAQEILDRLHTLDAQTFPKPLKPCWLE